MILNVSPLLYLLSSVLQFHAEEWHIYHWRELLQVSFLSRQNFCRDKSMLVATELCFLRQIFVAINIILSRQKFCCDKYIFVATKMVPVAAPAMTHIVCLDNFI